MIAGLAVRAIGFDRDNVDFVLPEHGDVDTSFYRFHPDEHSVVSSALRFDDAFAPPITMYGNLPYYLLRPFLTDNSDPYRTGRVLSLLLSALCLPAVWFLARAIVAPAAAVLAVALLAVAPAAIQQAHFYTVDSLFCLLCTAALAAIVRSSDRDTVGLALLVGALIGLAASVRLNAALLGVVFLVAQALRHRSAWQPFRHRQLWLAGGASLVVLLALQPYLLTAPHLLLEARGPLDFSQVMNVVSGADLQFYTLQYLHTTPLLYGWTHLLPLSIGTGLTLAAVAGFGLGIVRPDGRRGLLLIWVALYVVTAGTLMVKPVRYLLPIVPVLLVLAADVCVRLWHVERRQWIARLLVAGVVAHGVVYGLAYLRVWTTEDSRIQAGRWIANHVPAGQSIVVERGAFPLRTVISQQRHNVRQLRLTTLFSARGHMLCSSSAEWIERDIGAAEFIAITEINRAEQVAAAPEQLPVLTSFYRHLLNDELGYETVQRFKVTPSFAGITFPDDGAEHTWIGFDHPAVRILKRAPSADARRAWNSWATSLQSESFCADAALHHGANALRQGDSEQALHIFEQASQASVSRYLARFLAVRARGQAGLPPTGRAVALHDLMPLSLIDLGLTDEALRLIVILARRATTDPCVTARSFVEVAAHLDRQDNSQAARNVERVAQALCEQP